MTKTKTEIKTWALVRKGKRGKPHFWLCVQGGQHHDSNQQGSTRREFWT